METAALPPQALLSEIPSDQTPILDEAIDDHIKTYIDLISSPLGSKHLYNSDEFFAPAINLTNPLPPISRPGVFVPTGAWYDGWETRRHNSSESDCVIIRLGTAAGLVKAIEIDTAFFTGNYAPEISVEAAYITSSDADDVVVKAGFNQWSEILSRRECSGDTRHLWRLRGDVTEQPVTHVRLRQYPDGGIARFRCYGTALPVWPEDSSQEVELSAMTNGGRCTSVSDQHYGTGANLLLPGRGKDMGDGWETKRSRGKDHVDWVVIKLGARGKIGRVVVDTAFFRGNFPRAVKVHAVNSDEDPAVDDESWVEVLGETKMGADTEFVFKDEVKVKGAVFSHVKMTMIPDGGVKRLRIFGTRA